MKKPNIVLIITDQMRSDCMGIAGNSVIETPYLDTMAGKGALFTNAYSAVPSCIPARAALMTGLSQKSHGRVGYQDGITWNYNNYLAEEFSRAGYHTQCIGKMHVHPYRALCGFHNIILHNGNMNYYRSQGVAFEDNFYVCDDYINWLREKKTPRADNLDTGLEANSWMARPWIYEEHLHSTNWTVDQSIDFLRRKDPSRPFFLTMSFIRPHSPLDPPEHYFKLYQDKNVPMPLMGNWADKEDKNHDGIVYNTSEGIVDAKAVKKARAAYYGCITHIDHQLGRFFQSLGEYGVMENTIIFFTSDHGDMMGDHNLFRKTLPYKGSASIPFIVYDPGNTIGFEPGIKINEIVELRDIMPSLLEFAGINIPGSVEGKSVLPLLKRKNILWRDYIHGEHAAGIKTNQFIVTENDKYIWFPKTNREQYFDLKNDHDELCDLSNETSWRRRIEYLKRLLVLELEGREEGYSDGNALIPGNKQVNYLSGLPS